MVAKSCGWTTLREIDEIQSIMGQPHLPIGFPRVSQTIRLEPRGHRINARAWGKFDIWLGHPLSVHRTMPVTGKMVILQNMPGKQVSSQTAHLKSLQAKLRSSLQMKRKPSFKPAPRQTESRQACPVSPQTWHRLRPTSSIPGSKH